VVGHAEDTYPLGIESVRIAGGEIGALIVLPYRGHCAAERGGTRTKFYVFGIPARDVSNECGKIELRRQVQFGGTAGQARARRHPPLVSYPHEVRQSVVAHQQEKIDYV
jgi:hypothetical protein